MGQTEIFIRHFPFCIWDTSRHRRLSQRGFHSEAMKNHRIREIIVLIG